MRFDPRVFFAAERTLLAWVRSGITVMPRGFGVPIPQAFKGDGYFY
jgi:putative membrane protein